MSPPLQRRSIFIVPTKPWGSFICNSKVENVTFPLTPLKCLKTSFSAASLVPLRLLIGEHCEWRALPCQSVVKLGYCTVRYRSVLTGPKIICLIDRAGFAVVSRTSGTDGSFLYLCFESDSSSSSVCELDSCSPVQPTTSWLPQRAPVRRIMEDELALEQTAAAPH